ncbi:MAG TPA: hypothetical protein VH352_02715 [Pseudonocardiaceae bacterium]|nr:hypothetical protein [Pseudonocardiaceae bacterium]
MTDPNPDGELNGIEYFRNVAAEEIQKCLPGLIEAHAGAKLRRIAEAGYANADEILGPSAVLTRSQMLGGFLAQDNIPTARTVFDTTARRDRLLAAMERIPVAEFGQGAGRVFRDDGRNPWNTILQDGFRHRSIAADAATVIAGLRAAAATMGISAWANFYHISNIGNGVPTVSTARNPNASSGATNAGWQYAIAVPNLPHVYPVQDLTVTILGSANIAGGEHDNTELLMDAPLLGGATNIAISGGPMDEFTFLTAIRPEWIVGFRRQSVQGELAWRTPFEQQWRAVADAPAIRAILEEAGEFTFPE